VARKVPVNAAPFANSWCARFLRNAGAARLR
jgi:hypothetical protein